jgi:hypothetical protein
MTAGNPDSLARHPEARSAAIFAFLAAAVIVLVWIYRLAIAGIPELQAQPWLTWLHLIAEIATAVVLVVGGWALLAGTHWARKAYLLGVGMLLFGALADIGRYADSGNTGLSIFFFLVAVVSVVFVIRAER